MRLDITERVCTTNEGKKGGQVFHHEQAQTPLCPSKLFFYCEYPADEGGGTAVCPSDEVRDYAPPRRCPGHLRGDLTVTMP